MLSALPNIPPIWTYGDKHVHGWGTCPVSTNLSRLVLVLKNVACLGRSEHPIHQLTRFGLNVTAVRSSTLFSPAQPWILMQPLCRISTILRRIPDNMPFSLRRINCHSHQPSFPPGAGYSDSSTMLDAYHFQ